MNYKFPSSLENYPPNPNPNPNYNTNPNTSYFAQQATQAGYINNDVNRREFESFTTYDVRNQQFDNYTTSNAVGRRQFDYNFYQNPGSDPWELEKERIRKEIIAEETLRRRMLEDEVRREMMLERELPLRHGEGGVGGSWGSMRIEPRHVSDFEHREFEYRGGYSTMPYNRPMFLGSGSGVTLREIKEVNGVVAPPVVSKDNAIVLAKPRANLTHLKRKKMTPAVGGPSKVFKRQKTNDGWHCELCQITTTSERGLKDHFKGKKHKALELGTTAPRTGFGTAPLPTTISSSNTVKPLLSIPKIPSLKKETHTLSKSKGSLGKKGNGKAKVKAAKMKKKFRFFCEMCQIGANSEVVFAAHKMGKKHLANLSVSKTDGATLIGPSSERVVPEENKVVVEKQPGETSGGKRGNGKLKAKAKAKKAPAIGKPKKEYPFFCEICQAGANSMIVFNAHKNGKKHLAILSELNKTDKTPQAEASIAVKAVAKENRELVPGEKIDGDISKVELVGTVLEVEVGDTLATAVLEVEGGDTLATETIDQASVCNEIDC